MKLKALHIYYEESIESIKIIDFPRKL